MCHPEKRCTKHIQDSLLWWEDEAITASHRRGFGRELEATEGDNTFSLPQAGDVAPNQHVNDL